LGWSIRRRCIAASAPPAAGAACERDPCQVRAALNQWWQRGALERRIVGAPV